MQLRRLLIAAAALCEFLAVVGADLRVALVPLGLALYFTAEFV